MSAAPIIEGRDLVKHFGGGGLLTRRPVVRAVDGVSLAIAPGETFAIVGESGCGKSTLGRLLLRLIEPTAGQVLFEGRDITKVPGETMRRLRRDMQIIFQDPYGSLNPRMSVGSLIAEPMAVHGVATGEAARARVAELLGIVGLLPEHAARYPHEFSGGQRQRIGIARALACSPKLIVGDEPVSALDVSIRAQVINLLEDLKGRFGLTLLLVSHDLAVVRHTSDRIAVMYLGEIVEVAPTDALFEAPGHPYTRALLAAIPNPSPLGRGPKALLEGDVPSPAAPPPGCRFHTRCPHAVAVCRETRPPAVTVADGHVVACHRVREIAMAGASPIAPIAPRESKRQRLALFAAARAAQDARAAKAAVPGPSS